MARVGPKVTKNHCELVSHKLILKYPFMKDDIGKGYVSDEVSVCSVCSIMYNAADLYMQLHACPGLLCKCGF